MRIKLYSFILLLACALVFCNGAFAQYKLKRSDFTNGAGPTSNSHYSSVVNVGIPLLGEASNDSYITKSGPIALALELQTDVLHDPEMVPEEYRLDQNYPNPFNPSTTISFGLPKPGKVTIKLYNMLGREISTLVDEEMQAGEHKVIFSAEELPSGVYFYRLQTESYVAMRKAMVVK